MNINAILKTSTLQELLAALEEFCKNAIIRDDDTECMELKAGIEMAESNDYFLILSSYLAAAEDGDEVIEALYEFVSNCRTFVEAEEETTEQITKDEFEAVLTECEEKCAVRTCIEAEHILNIAEVPMASRCTELCIREKNSSINIFLPKHDVQVCADKEKHIANLIGTALYKVISRKIEPDYIFQEMKRYIPMCRTEEKSAKNLFVEYFYDVVKYKDRKPGIYTHFDKHMERVLVIGFYARIIQEYFRHLE